MQVYEITTRILVLYRTPTEQDIATNFCSIYPQQTLALKYEVGNEIVMHFLLTFVQPRFQTVVRAY